MKINLEALDLEAAVHTYLTDQGLSLDDADTLFHFEGECSITITPKADEVEIEEVEQKILNPKAKPKQKRKRRSSAEVAAEKAAQEKAKEEEVDAPEEVEEPADEPVSESEDVTSAASIFGSKATNTVEEETAEADEDGEDASALFG